MQIILLVTVLCVIFKLIAEYEPMNKRINKMDNDPTCSIKSNKWHREHDNK
jgi:hypothetical protein